MRLRGGLLLSAALLLMLAALGLSLQRQFDALQWQQQALLASAETLARALQRPGAGLPLEDPPGPGLPLFPLLTAPKIDGFEDDWAPWTPMALPRSEAASLPVSMLLGADPRGVYLWLFVADTSRVRAGSLPLLGPALADQLVLHLSSEAGQLRYRFLPVAPGSLDGERLDAPLPGLPLAVGAAFQERAEGWSLELALPPLPPGTRLGVEVLDWARAGERQPQRRGGTLDGEGRVQLHGLRGRYTRLERTLQTLAPAGTRARIVDAQGWLRAEVGELGLADPSASGLRLGDGFERWLQRRLLSGRLLPAEDFQPQLARLEAPLLDQARAGAPAWAWRIASDRRTVVGMVALPLGAGTVLLLERAAAGRVG